MNRQLPPGSSLARLLADERGRRGPIGQPPLSKKKILRWADLQLSEPRTLVSGLSSDPPLTNVRGSGGPNVHSGPVVDVPGERWNLIDHALRQGHRRLPGGSSLLLLLVHKRGVRHPLKPGPLGEEQIVRWADRHRQRTGSWPNYTSGALADAPGETWAGIDSALRYGRRELPGGSSLAKLLEKSPLERKEPDSCPTVWKRRMSPNAFADEKPSAQMWIALVIGKLSQKA